MTQNRVSSRRGISQEIILRSRRVCYYENGLRSVPLEQTLAELELFFLTSPLEVQFHTLGLPENKMSRAILNYFSPEGKSEDRFYSGKGLSSGQALASACLEFLERYCAVSRPDDVIRESSYHQVTAEAIDPCLFSLAPDTDYDPEREIDWIWGYSLTRAEHVRVPANLVFCPYQPLSDDKYFARADSNGLASGNNLEEAVLHALLEVLERDAIIISEFNRLPCIGIAPAGLPPECQPTLDLLSRRGFGFSFFTVLTDLPFPFIAAMLRHRENPADCSVAFGCHLDPDLAMGRALTEAIQLLPPSANHKGWMRSGSPRRYSSRPLSEISLKDLNKLASSDLRKNIEKCVSILKGIGSEVIVVDLSVPDIPFPVVRVLATGLQPILRKDDMRLSKRFLEMPMKLGLRAKPLSPADVRIWPICGFR